MKPRVVFILALSVLVVITLGGYQYLSAHAKQPNTEIKPSIDPAPINYSNPPATPTPSTPVKNIEELNKQGARRPVQYVHVCSTDDDITYYSQGSPSCLDNDTLEEADTGLEAGTAYSSPCKTTTGTTRYVYISNDETCPAGTKIQFYNSLGGSTQGPGGTDDSTTLQ